MKQKHVLFAHIMKIIIEFEVNEKYFDKGTNPLLTTLQKEAIPFAVDTLISHSRSNLDDEDLFIKRGKPLFSNLEPIICIAWYIHTHDMSNFLLCSIP